MGISRRDVLIAGAAGAAISSKTLARQASDGSLRELASRRNLFFGCALTSSQLREPAYRDLLRRECSHLVPEWEMKWGHLEPEPGRFIEDGADTIAAVATQNGSKLRGHALVWHRNLPTWFAGAVERDGFDKVEAHIERTMLRYPQADQWDVVNEAIDPSEYGGMRRSPFLAAFGPDYVARCFATARRVAPQTTLYFNEYGVDYDGSVERSRRLALLRLLEQLKKEGAPVDCIGIQGHLRLQAPAFSEASFRAFLSSIASFGVGIAITELDVREDDYSASESERDRRVAVEVKRYLDVVLDEPAVKGICTWGMSDRWSWLSTAKLAESDLRNRGLPYDATFRSKPMRSAIAAALCGRPLEL